MSLLSRDASSARAAPKVDFTSASACTPRGNGAGPAAVDSKQHGLASMACLGSLAAAHRHRSTSVRRHRSKPVRPTASLSYLEGSNVEPPSKVHENTEKEQLMPIQAYSFSVCEQTRVQGAVHGAVACTCESDVLRQQRPARVQSGTDAVPAPRVAPHAFSVRYSL